MGHLSSWNLNLYIIIARQDNVKNLIIELKN